MRFEWICLTRTGKIVTTNNHNLHGGTLSTESSTEKLQYAYCEIYLLREGLVASLVTLVTLVLVTSRRKR